MSTELKPPCRYGKFEIIERIGAGGMAEVYLAKMPGIAGFQKTVVVKRLHPRHAGSDEFARMFIEEAKLAAQVQHKNVVQVFELEAIANGELYMAMEWVDGIDLKRMLRAAAKKRRRVPPWLCIHIMSEVLEALAYAHNLTDDRGRRRNIVHCDVTPENIFLSKLGDVKLADFGVALDDTRSSDAFSGQVKGKVPYLSPEQISGERPDQRSDVFGCAIVLWESLTLHRLFSGGSATETMSRICMAKRTPPSQIAPGIPPELDRAVLRALEANAAQRTPTARAFQQELLQVLDILRPRLGLPDIGAAIRDLFGDEVGALPNAPAAVELSIDVDCRSSSVELLDDDDAAYADAFDLDEPRSAASTSSRASNAGGFTYSIIKPKYAVDELGSKASQPTPTPMPMPGIPANVETGDLIRQGRATHRAPIPALPGRHNTSDVLKKNGRAAPGKLFLRTSQTRVLGPVNSLDVVGALADLLESGEPARAEISGDGERWMTWQRFGELLGEQIVDSTLSLPDNEFKGNLSRHSLPAIFGQLARTRSTGCLILSRGSERGLERREIHVQDGQLLGLCSNRTQFAGWNELILTPELRPPALSTYIQQVALEATPLSEIAPPDVLNAVASGRARTMQAMLTEVFTWTVGDFGFDPTTVSTAAVTPVSLLAALPGVVSKTKSAAQLRAALMRMLDTRLIRAARFDAEVEALGLRSAPRTVAESIGRGHSLAESLSQCRTAEDERIALVVAYLLVELGLLMPQANVPHYT